MVSYINPANHAPGIQNGHTVGVISSHRHMMGKLKILWNHETHSLYILFSMLQCLVVSYINPTNPIPEVKSKLAMPWTSFINIELYTMVMQNVLSLIGFLGLSQVYFKMLHCTNDTRLFRSNCFPTERVISNWNRCSHIHWPIYLLQ